MPYEEFALKLFERLAGQTGTEGSLGVTIAIIAASFNQGSFEGAEALQTPYSREYSCEV